MKKIKVMIIGATVAATFAIVSAASAECEILIPADKCDEVIGGSYSTGGGDQAVQYAKIFCSTKDGAYIHMPQKISKAGLLGKLTGSRTIGRMVSTDECKITITDRVKEAEFD